MGTIRHFRTFAATVALACALALTLAGCVAPSDQQTSTDEHAADNRAYMAQLNQKMAELSGVLDEFQGAVGSEDVVAMKASDAQASAIVAEVKALEAPEKLQPIKDDYMNGLDQMQQALDQYTQLYTELSAGTIDQASYSDRLRQVQEAYDQGVAALQAADEQAVAVANE